MFEKFTESARRVIILAQEESRALRHHYIGTEHLLLGLLNEGEGTAASALAGLGVSLASAREQAAALVGPTEESDSPSIPFTPRAKKVLELSLREAQRLRDHEIDTGHILLGLLDEGGGVGAQVLAGLDVDLDRLREDVERLLTDGPHEP